MFYFSNFWFYYISGLHTYFNNQAYRIQTLVAVDAVKNIQNLISLVEEQRNISNPEIDFNNRTIMKVH